MSEKSIQKKRNSLFQQAALRVFPVLRQERTQSFIVITLTFLSLIIFGLFAIDPTIATIIQLRKQLADDSLVHNKLQEKITNLSILQGKYATIQASLPVVLAAVPENNDVSEIMADTQGIATKTNVTIVSMQSDPLMITNDPTEKGNNVTFSITIQGTRQDVLNFINTFFSFQRLITVKQISISTTNTEQGSATQALIQGQAMFKPLQ